MTLAEATQRNGEEGTLARAELRDVSKRFVAAVW
jgi:hypothetical protein